MRLVLLISTIDEGIERVPGMLLPAKPWLRYAVSWQRTTADIEVPKSLLCRKDVEIGEQWGRGLSRNRNHALLMATADEIALLCDNDERFFLEGLTQLVAYYEHHPEADIVLCKAEGLNKSYPPEPCVYSGECNAYYACSVEMSMRVGRIQQTGVRFDERFGLGAPLFTAGEEEVFLFDARRRGLREEWVPITVCATQGHTTGTQFLSSKGVRMAKGAVWTHTHGRSWALYKALKEAAWYFLHRGSNPFRLFVDMASPIFDLEKKHDTHAIALRDNVTIIIPFFNRARLMERMLASLARVEWGSLRVIFVDNGSTDGSRRLVETFCRVVPFEACVVDEPTPGAARARNKGLSMVETPWVYFFDSDDEFSPDFLSATMTDGEDCDAVFLPVRQIIGEGSPRIRAYRRSRRPAVQILNSMFCTPSLIWRTAYLREIGGWDARLRVWDDWELGVRLLARGGRIKWNTKQAFHRLYVHTDSLTGPTFSSRLKESIETMDVVETYLTDSADHRALTLRRAIFEGQIEKEGVVFPPRRGLAKWIRTYVRRGGRGAWRIALFCCSKH